MIIPRRLFLGIAGAAALRFPLQSQPQTYTFEPVPAGRTLKTPDGRTVFTYLTQKPEGVPLAGNNACCFHPVNTPAGERVTDIAPPDHRDHRGAFFAWGNMDFHPKTGDLRADFWGWGHYAPTEGRVIRNRDLRLVNASANSAEIAIENDWLIDDRKVLNESTTARTRQEQSANILDLVFRFTSPDDFTVDRMAFTGFVVRCREDGQSFLSDSKGEVSLPNSNALKPETDWPAENWYSYTIALNSGKTVAAAVIDHPSNPRSLWHEPRAVHFLNPCISAIQPVSVPAGQPLTLRYRTAFNDGAFPDGMLDRLAAEWHESK
jgi:hypothetical protein